MLEIQASNRLKKDLKIAEKRGYDLSKFIDVVNTLARAEPLPSKNHDHELSGNYAGFRECHIQPDWLLIYKIYNSDLILFLSRTGTHADLF